MPRKKHQKLENLEEDKKEVSYPVWLGKKFREPDTNEKITLTNVKKKKGGIESGRQGEAADKSIHMIKPIYRLGLFFLSPEKEHIVDWVTDRHLKIKLDKIQSIDKNGVRHAYFYWARNTLANLEEKELLKLMLLENGSKVEELPEDDFRKELYDLWWFHQMGKVRAREAKSRKGGKNEKNKAPWPDDGRVDGREPAFNAKWPPDDSATTVPPHQSNTSQEIDFVDDRSKWNDDDKWAAVLKTIMTDEKEHVKVTNKQISSVITDQEKSKMAFFKKIKHGIEAAIRVIGKSKSRYALNQSVILEYLSGEVLRAKGFDTHEVNLIKQSKDGEPLLLALDVKYSVGFKDLNEKKSDVFVVEGCLVKKKGDHYVPATFKDIKGLSASEAAFRGLCDYDAFGSTGGNKGIIDGRLHIIDTGNAFNGKDKPLREDFTVEGKDLKNFGLYADQPHSHRMAGVILEYKMRHGELPPAYEWLDRDNLSLESIKSGCKDMLGESLSDAEAEFWLDLAIQLKKVKKDDDLACFEKMIEKLEKASKLENDPSLQSLAADVEKKKAEYLARSERLLKTFEKKLTLTPTQVDMLQEIQRVCSQTVASKTTKAGHVIAFDPPRVINAFPIEWKLNNGDLEIVFKGKDKKANERARDALLNALPNIAVINVSERGGIILEKDNINQANIKMLQQFCKDRHDKTAAAALGPNPPPILPQMEGGDKERLLPQKEQPSLLKRLFRKNPKP